MCHRPRTSNRSTILKMIYLVPTCYTCDGTNGFTFEHGYDSDQEYDLGDAFHRTYGMCSQYCIDTQDCIAFVYNPNRLKGSNCYLQFDVTGRVKNSDKWVTILSRRCQLVDVTSSQQTSNTPNDICDEGKIIYFVRKSRYEHLLCKVF